MKKKINMQNSHKNILVKDRCISRSRTIDTNSLNIIIKIYFSKRSIFLVHWLWISLQLIVIKTSSCTNSKHIYSENLPHIPIQLQFRNFSLICWNRVRMVCKLLPGKYSVAYIFFKHVLKCTLFSSWHRARHWPWIRCMQSPLLLHYIRFKWRMTVFNAQM